MAAIDFSQPATQRLHEVLVKTYGRNDLLTDRLARAGIRPSEIPFQSSVEMTWQVILMEVDGTSRLDALLDAVLADPKAVDAHVEIKAFRARRTDGRLDSFVVEATDPSASIQLLCKTLYRHLGNYAPDISRKLVERLVGERKLSGAELFDATRFAIEYQLLVADDLSPTRLLDADDQRGEDEAFAQLLRQALKESPLRQIEVTVAPNEFFSRTLERKADWEIYFKTLYQLLGADPTISSSLCRIRTEGFLAPQYLIAGLLQRYEDDWRPIIAGYRHQIGGRPSAFVNYQASLWNTWTVWGPSNAICQCKEWDGICALQYGYGDENNSMPIIGAASGAPASLEYSAGGHASNEPASGAVFRRLTGRLRWAPWLLRQSTGAGQTDASATSGFETFPAARAQRAIYKGARQGNPRDALVFQAEAAGDSSTAQDSYFSAYLWLMFLVARKPTAPGQAPRRLSGTYPALDARAADRRAERLWRELLPVYVHANIADARALAMHRHTLVNNAICQLRELWVHQAALFPGVDRAELCFYLVGGSDYSGCGHQIRFLSPDSVVERLRARLDVEADRDFASSIVLPPEDETPTTRPPELVTFYSTCHLPDLVGDYYNYVDELTIE